MAFTKATRATPRDPARATALTHEQQAALAELTPEQIANLANAHRKKGLPWGVRWQRYLRGNAIVHIQIALVLNTALAQLFYNSAGTILPPGVWTLDYLKASATLSTIAFSLFEIRQVNALNEMFKSGVKYHWSEWAKSVFVLIIISGYNFYAVALLNAAIWPDLLFSKIPEPPKPFKYYLHAAFYTAILFSAGLVGERKRSATEEVAHAREEIQGRVLKNAVDEAHGMIEGKTGLGRAIVTMVAMGNAEAQLFFGNFMQAMTGQISMQDVIAHNHVAGVIVPGTATTSTEIPAPPENNSLVAGNKGVEPGKSANNQPDETPEIATPPAAQEGDLNILPSGTPQEGSTENGSGGAPVQGIAQIAQFLAPLALGNSYDLPDGMELDQEMAQSVICVMMGISDSTLVKRWEEGQMTIPGTPRREGNRRFWTPRLILWMYENGYLDGINTSTIEEMARQEVVA